MVWLHVAVGIYFESFLKGKVRGDKLNGPPVTCFQSLSKILIRNLPLACNFEALYSLKITLIIHDIIFNIAYLQLNPNNKHTHYN